MLRKLLPWVALAVLTVLADAWLVMYCRDLWANHARLDALGREWEASGPRSTVTGRLRTRLAAYAWLGPLRPDVPPDPLAECGVPAAGGGWWRALLLLPTVRWRRACLEDRMGMAEAGVHHSQWEEWLLAGACLVHLCVTTGIGGLLAGSAAAPKAAPEVVQQAARKAAKKAAPKAEQKAAPKADPVGPVKASRRPSLVWQYLKENPLLARMRKTYRDAKERRRAKRRQRREAAMQAELRRQRLKAAGHKVSVDSMDWWRGADDGSGKLVVRPRESLAEVFRPYRGYFSPDIAEGPAEPRPAGPDEPRPVGPEESHPVLEEERRPTAVQRLSAAAWLQPLLLLLNLIVLVYLCLRGGAAT